MDQTITNRSIPHKKQKNSKQNLKIEKGLYGTINTEFMDISDESDSQQVEEVFDVQSNHSVSTDKHSSAEPPKEQRSFKDKLIISSENKIKSFFDVWVLVLVGYSCVTSMYYVAFSKPTNKIHIIWDEIVEYHFYLDIVLSFFCEYRDPDTNIQERNFKKIA